MRLICTRTFGLDRKMGRECEHRRVTISDSTNTSSRRTRSREARSAATRRPEPTATTVRTRPAAEQLPISTTRDAREALTFHRARAATVDELPHLRIWAPKPLAPARPKPFIAVASPRHPPTPCRTRWPGSLLGGRVAVAARAGRALARDAGDRQPLGGHARALLARPADRARLPRARARDQRGSAPPARREAPPDRTRLRRQRRLPRPPRPRDAYRVHRREERRLRARDPGRPRPGRRLRGRLGGRVPARDLARDRPLRARAAGARPGRDRRLGGGLGRRPSPLHKAVTPQQVDTPLAAVAAVGVVLYGFAATAYLRVYRRRESLLAFAVAFAFALLAEALVVVVVSLTTSWQLSWWEWHALMLIGFVSIAAAASREWYEERFSALYLDETLRGHKEISVLFADLEGFTPFTEERGSEEVFAMLVAYFGRLAPLIRDEFGGEVPEFVGDQIFAVFNKAGDQPDHAVRAAAAGLALQRTAAEIAAGHPERPIFRVGVNSGEAIVGVVGERGHRIHGVFGDTVNLGARLEGQAPPGGARQRSGTSQERSPQEPWSSAFPTCRSRARPSRSSPTSCASCRNDDLEHRPRRRRRRLARQGARERRAASPASSPGRACLRSRWSRRCAPSPTAGSGRSSRSASPRPSAADSSPPIRSTWARAGPASTSRRRSGSRPGS